MKREMEQRRNRHGFSLVELVVVVLIMGIIAAVAAPKMFNAATNARDSGAKQSLSVVRDAIELYKAQYDVYPAADGLEATLKSNLKPFLQGPFPKCPVGAKDDTVRVQTTGTPLAVSGTQSWAYDNQSGEFIINNASYSTY